MRYIDHGDGGGPSRHAQHNPPPPVPGPEDILIEVAYAGVNRPDCAQRIGRYPPPPGASPVLGLEVAGRVAALGERVRDWRVGDRVCALTPGGGYADYCTAPAGHCLPVPQGWSLSEAAGLPEACFTVWDNLFRRARLAPGEVVLIHGGSGGVGNAAIQLARALGATVLTTCGSAAKAERCRQLGAHHTILYREQDFVQEALALTGGRGVDVILDMVAGPYLARDLEALALDGRIAVIAFMGGTQAQIEVIPLLRKRAQITGSTLRPCSVEHKSAIARELRAQVWPHLDAGLGRPAVEAVFAPEQAADAHRLMESGQHFGKLLIAMNGSIA